MTLTYEELKTETDNTFKDRTLVDWKAASDYRGITQRSQKDFDWLLSMYPRKIEKLSEMLADSKDAEMQIFLTTKIARIKDKFATCIKEVQMRKDVDVVRTNLHDQAVYYIDYGRADDTGNGLSTGAAYKTITKYTTTEIRTPGDIAYVRAGVTWPQGTLAVDITFDEDGTPDLYISIIGCDSVTNDPWGDASDVKPIIDFEDGAYQCTLNGDNYWHIDRVDFMQSADSLGCFYCTAAYNNKLEDCVIRDGASSSVEGLNLSNASIVLSGCSFSDCDGISILITNAYALIDNCTIDAGGAVGSTYGVFLTSGSNVDIVDTTIAGSNAFDTAEVYARYSSRVRMRNVTFGASETLTVLDSSEMFSEDHDGTFENQLTKYSNGTITRGTASPRSGGADSFAIMAPDSSCGLNSPLKLENNPLSGAFKIWLTAAEHTVTVYARDPDNWATQPGNSGGEETFYIQASYLSNGASAARSLSTKSAQDSTGDAAWVGYTTTFTMAREGWAYISVVLAAYESGKTMEVDIKPVAVVS